MFLLAASRYKNNDSKYNWKGASRAEKYLCSSTTREKEPRKKRGRNGMRRKKQKKKCDVLCVVLALPKNNAEKWWLLFIKSECVCLTRNRNKRTEHQDGKNKIFAMRLGCGERERERFYCFYLSDYRKRWSEQSAHSNSTDKMRHGFVHIWCNGGGGGCSPTESNCALA